MNRYLVLTFRKPEFDPAVIDPHYAFLETLRARGQLELAGPFSDMSGGAYLLRVQDMAAAEAIAFADPVHTSGSSAVSVYAWDAK